LSPIVDESSQPEELPFIDDNMDDRESVYLDTISFMSDSTYNNNYRKSINLSRQTLYHSTLDLQETNDDTVDGDDVRSNGDVHHKKATAKMLANEQHGYTEDSDDLTYATMASSKNEVSALLLTKNCHSTPLTTNRKTKPIVTYSQWKNRVHTNLRKI
jgi:hypothetical protein